MELTPKTKELLQQLEDKFGAIGQNLDTHLEGLVALYSNNLLGLHTNRCTTRAANTAHQPAR